jgi:hypothetical protein
MLNISTFIANVALLIGGSTIHSLIGLSIDQNVKYKIFKNNLKIGQIFIIWLLVFFWQIYKFIYLNTLGMKVPILFIKMDKKT